jgi:hypothetical protein
VEQCGLCQLPSQWQLTRTSRRDFASATRK